MIFILFLSSLIDHSAYQVEVDELAGTCGCVMVGPPGTVLGLGTCGCP